MWALRWKIICRDLPERDAGEGAAHKHAASPLAAVQLHRGAQQSAPVHVNNTILRPFRVLHTLAALSSPPRTPSGAGGSPAPRHSMTTFLVLF